MTYLYIFKKEFFNFFSKILQFSVYKLTRFIIFILSNYCLKILLLIKFQFFCSIHEHLQIVHGQNRKIISVRQPVVFGPAKFLQLSNWFLHILYVYNHCHLPLNTVLPPFLCFIALTWASRTVLNRMRVDVFAFFLVLQREQCHSLSTLQGGVFFFLFSLFNQVENVSFYIYIC